MGEEFQWTAFFEGKEPIPQYNADGSENSFKLVQNDFDRLSFFSLDDSETGEGFDVNLKTGEFVLNGLPVCPLELPEGTKYRLIFFRRRRAIMPSTEIETEYWLGWQATIEGKNIKKLLRIAKGRFFLCDES